MSEFGDDFNDDAPDLCEIDSDHTMDTEDDSDAFVPEVDDAPDAMNDMEDSGEKTYPFDSDAWWQRGMNAIDQNVDAIRDNYLDQGYEQGEELDTMLANDREMLENEFNADFLSNETEENSESINDAENDDASAQDFSGELNAPEFEPEADEALPEAPENTDDEDLEDYYGDYAAEEVEEGGESIDDAENDDASLQDFSGDVNAPEFEPEADEIPLETPYSGEIAEEGHPDDTNEIAPEIDEELVYEGLDEYDLDDIDITADEEQLCESLEGFQDDNWSAKDLEGEKESVSALADYLGSTLHLDRMPAIEYYNNPDPGDFGGYSHEDNVLSINEYTLDNNEEAVDTVAHELWHAYQHQCAEHPRPGNVGSIDWQRQFGLDPHHYVRPQYGKDGRCINFDEYQSQLVEAEARAFASQVKDFLRGVKRHG